jgi:hypothetical protein
MKSKKATREWESLRHLLESKNVGNQAQGLNRVQVQVEVNKRNLASRIGERSLNQEVDQQGVIAESATLHLGHLVLVQVQVTWIKDQKTKEGTWVQGKDKVNTSNRFADGELTVGTIWKAIVGTVTILKKLHRVEIRDIKEEVTVQEEPKFKGNDMILSAEVLQEKISVESKEKVLIVKIRSRMILNYQR